MGQGCGAGAWGDAGAVVGWHGLMLWSGIRPRWRCSLVEGDGFKLVGAAAKWGVGHEVGGGVAWGEKQPCREGDDGWISA